MHFHTAVVINFCSRWKAKGIKWLKYGFRLGCSILATVFISKMTLSFIAAHLVKVLNEYIEFIRYYY